MQDSAEAHTTNNSLKVLAIVFREKWPILSSSDFCFWVTLQESV